MTRPDSHAPTMKPADLQDGQRVRIVRPIEIYPIAIFGPGLTGTVEDVDLTSRDVIAHVRLDNSFDGLAEWGNRLQVWADGSQGANCTPDAFEALPALRTASRPGGPTP